MLAVWGSLSGALNAQEPRRPEIFLASPQNRSSRAADGPGRSKYSVGISQIKNAPMESESVFLERVGKESKIENARAHVAEAKQRLSDLRRDLSPPGMDHLGDADREFDRSLGFIDTAAQNLDAARAELRRFHEAATPEAVAIASGNVSAAPLYMKIRREIKTVERNLRSATVYFAEAQAKLDLAQRDAKAALEQLPANSPSRAIISESLRGVDRVGEALSKANRQVNDGIATLEAIRREHLPECASDSGPALPPGRRDDEAADTSRRLLRQSSPAIELLDAAREELTGIDAAVARLDEAAQAVIRATEQADSTAHPANGDARRLEERASKLLDQADDQLDDSKRALTEDAPGESKVCDCCGKQFARTRRVIDPAALCERAEPGMRQAAQSLRDSRQLAEDIFKLLAKEEDSLAKQIEQLREPLSEQDKKQKAALEESLRRVSSAIQKMRGAPNTGGRGAIELLAVAIDRAEEFRKQQFDFYPAESALVLAEEVPPRNFPPMELQYVARQTWHYADYFEDLALERYGQHFGCFQPVLSYGKFLLDLAMVPYNAVLHSPYERQYTLGLYRPGDDLPHLIYLPEPNFWAAVSEGASITGLFYLP